MAKQLQADLHHLQKPVSQSWLKSYSAVVSRHICCECFRGTMAVKFDSVFESKFEAVLNNPTKPVDSKLQELLFLMEEYKISYKLVKVNPKFFFVHKANRGGLGLNPYNAHKNATKIYSVGANLKHLVAAVAEGYSPSTCSGQACSWR